MPGQYIEFDADVCVGYLMNWDLLGKTLLLDFIALIRYHAGHLKLLPGAMRSK